MEANPVPRTSSARLVLTVGEAAELLGISRAFAYELVARGEIPAIRLGRRVVVPRVRLLAMIEGDPVAPGDPVAQYSDQPLAALRSRLCA